MFRDFVFVVSVGVLEIMGYCRTPVRLRNLVEPRVLVHVKVDLMEISACYRLYLHAPSSSLSHPRK